MSNCHWCDEGRPFLPGSKDQHVPLYGDDGEHGGAMCYNSPIYRELDSITDVVLAYRPKPKSKGAKRRTRRAKKAAKDAEDG